MSEMCGWLVGLPAPAPACMCGVEGSRPQPLTQASALKETESGEARAALTICGVSVNISTLRKSGLSSCLCVHSWQEWTLWANRTGSIIRHVVYVAVPSLEVPLASVTASIT